MCLVQVDGCQHIAWSGHVNDPWGVVVHCLPGDIRGEGPREPVSGVDVKLLQHLHAQATFPALPEVFQQGLGLGLLDGL